MYGTPALRAILTKNARLLTQASRVPTKPMSTNVTRAEKRTGRTDPRPNYFQLGVDQRGAIHVCDTTTSTVHIVHADGSRGRRHLDAGDLDDYMAAVESTHGWQRRDYGTSLVDILVDSLEQ